MTQGFFYDSTSRGTSDDMRLKFWRFFLGGRRKNGLKISKEKTYLTTQGPVTHKISKKKLLPVKRVVGEAVP